MTLLIVTIGLAILVWLNSKMIKILKNYRQVVNASRPEEIVTYKLAKLKANINNLKRL